LTQPQVKIYLDGMEGQKSQKKASTKRPSPVNGYPPPEGGRPKGTLNKQTVKFKEGVNKLLEVATPKMVEWLQEVADKDPAKALDLVYKFAQFGFPVLSRQTIDGSGARPVVVMQSVRVDGEALVFEVGRQPKMIEAEIVEEKVH